MDNDGILAVRKEDTLADIVVNWDLAPACVESITVRDNCGCERTVSRPRLKVTTVTLLTIELVPGVDVVTWPLPATAYDGFSD